MTSKLHPQFGLSHNLWKIIASPRVETQTGLASFRVKGGGYVRYERKTINEPFKVELSIEDVNEISTYTLSRLLIPQNEFRDVIEKFFQFIGKNQYPNLVFLLMWFISEGIFKYLELVPDNFEADTRAFISNMFENGTGKNLGP